MLKHTIYAIGIGLLVLFLYIMQYTGAFRSVTIAVDNRPALQVIYKDYMGPYHKIVTTIEEVEKWSKANGLKCRLSYGEYFDNPDVVEEGRLRAHGGCIIDPLVPAEKDLAAQLKIPAEFKLAEIPASKTVVALFSGAPGIGPLKVYPKANDFIEKEKLVKKGNVIEVYEIFDAKNMQTTYMWPVN